MRREIDRPAIAALSAGHLATDFANGVLPALLPFLLARFGLSYTEAGALVFASAAASSLVQPVFGHWSDRRGAVWLLPGGVALAGGGMVRAGLPEGTVYDGSWTEWGGRPETPKATNP